MSEAAKVALITGAGKQRIGFYVAEALAAHGYSLLIHYRTSATEALASVARYQARGLHAAALPADLADESAVRQMIEAGLAQFGRLDVLVNCAAVWHRKRAGRRDGGGRASAL